MMSARKSQIKTIMAWVNVTVETFREFYPKDVLKSNVEIDTNAKLYESNKAFVFKVKIRRVKYPNHVMVSFDSETKLITLTAITRLPETPLSLPLLKHTDVITTISMRDIHVNTGHLMNALIETLVYQLPSPTTTYSVYKDSNEAINNRGLYGRYVERGEKAIDTNVYKFYYQSSNNKDKIEAVEWVPSDVLADQARIAESVIKRRLGIWLIENPRSSIRNIYTQTQFNQFFVLKEPHENYKKKISSQASNTG